MAVKKTGKKGEGRKTSSRTKDPFHDLSEFGLSTDNRSPWKAELRRALSRIHKWGMQKLTIMVIPHTEKKIFNIHPNLYQMTGAIAVLIVVLVISVISLVGKSGESIEFYDMGLTNSQFNLQSIKIAEEIIPLHNVINNYTNTIAKLYLKMDGDPELLSGQGGDVQAVMGQEVESLNELINRCRELGDGCNQELTDEILRRVIYLSSNDNQSLSRAVEITDRIIAELKTGEKQNLLKNTPGIWPVVGYLRTPFGEQNDPIRGKRVFHQGIEIGALPGSDVLATAPGIVTEVGVDERFGLYIWIQHRFGIRTFYAHLDRARVSAGDRVSRSDVIGAVGKSGNAPDSMLYYEVHVGTVAYNPHAFLNHLQDQWLIKPNH